LDADCTVNVSAGIAVVRPSGDLDFTTMAPLRTRLREVTEQAGVREIVVDLSGVSFIDSSVLGLFVATSRRSRMSCIGFRLSRLGPRVLRILELTNLYDALANPAMAEANGHGGRQVAGGSGSA